MKQIKLSRKANVFVFDNNHEFCASLKAYLEAMSDDISVVKTCSNKEALLHLRNTPNYYDLVLCDACPDETDEPLLDIVLSAREHQAHCRIIVFTSKPNAAAVAKMFKAAADDMVISEEVRHTAAVFNRNSEESRESFLTQIREKVTALLEVVLAEHPANIVKCPIVLDKNQPIDFWPSVAEFMVALLHAAHLQMQDNHKRINKTTFAEHIKLVNDDLTDLKGFAMQRDPNKDRPDKSVSHLIELLQKMSSSAIVEELPVVLVEKKRMLPKNNSSKTTASKRKNSSTKIQRDKSS